MPYTDPHVAAPSLWAVRQEYGPDFQVSVAEPDDVDQRQRRLAIEEALIAVYRRESGENTTANFGRIIEGYKRSSQRADGFTGGELAEGETEPGVYRIWDRKESEPLEYIGQSGNLKSRLYRHRRNRDEELVFSYAIVDEGDAKHKREQVETDLIGANWLAIGAAPRDQF